MMIDVLDVLSREIRDAVRGMPDLSQRGLEVAMGADGSPTTGVDQVAEDAVLRYLDQEGLDWNVLSEEAGWIDRGGQTTLVLDPVDGTYNSVMGIPLYTASLALARSSLRDVSHAFIRNLANDDVYSAVHGGGAYYNGSPIRTRPWDGSAMVMVLYLGNQAHPRTFELLRSARRIRALGCASLEMCLVAQGSADAFYMNSLDPRKRIRVVDIAASQLLLREAGGELLDLDGRLLDMPLDLETRSNFLAVGDLRLKEEII